MALSKCGDCGRQVSDSAPTCPGCGRPLKRRGTSAASCGAWGCLLVLAIGGVVALLFGLGFIGIFAAKRNNVIGTPSPAPAEPAGMSPLPTPTPAANDVRLFRENHRLDDSARSFIFKSALKASGARCDSVESQLMGAAGVWTVRCAPGYQYRFTFDALGKLRSAERVN